VRSTLRGVFCGTIHRVFDLTYMANKGQAGGTRSIVENRRVKNQTDKRISGALGMSPTRRRSRTPGGGIRRNGARVEGWTGRLGRGFFLGVQVGRHE